MVLPKRHFYQLSTRFTTQYVVYGCMCDIDIGNAKIYKETTSPSFNMITIYIYTLAYLDSLFKTTTPLCYHSYKQTFNSVYGKNFPYQDYA